MKRVYLLAVLAIVVAAALGVAVAKHQGVSYLHLIRRIPHLAEPQPDAWTMDAQAGSRTVECKPTRRLPNKLLLALCILLLLKVSWQL